MVPGRHAKDPPGENMVGSDGGTTWVSGGEELGGQMGRSMGDRRRRSLGSDGEGIWPHEVVLLSWFLVFVVLFSVEV